MGWVNDALAELQAGRKVQVQPFGGSMRGRIEAGQLVTLEPVAAIDVRPDDIVLVKWRSDYLLHLVKQIQGNRLLIGNNLGKINGWVSADDLRGKVVAVADVPVQDATIVSAGPGFECTVALADGQIVFAHMSKQTARSLCILGPGMTVQVEGPVNGKYRIPSPNKPGYVRPSSASRP